MILPLSLGTTWLLSVEVFLTESKEDSSHEEPFDIGNHNLNKSINSIHIKKFTAFTKFNEIIYEK